MKFQQQIWPLAQIQDADRLLIQARLLKLQCHIQNVFRTVQNESGNLFPAQQIEGKPRKRILGRVCKDAPQQLFILQQIAQQGAGSKELGVGFQGKPQIMNCPLLFSPGAVDPGNFKIRLAAPGILPGSPLKEFVRSVRVSAELFQTSQQINGFRIRGVIVAAGELGNGPVQIDTGCFELRLFGAEPAQSQV